MMKISAQFATSLDSPEHIVAAEQLGYDRAWLFDTPHESPDVWMMLALAAERTTRIGLGPGVLVPSLRHPMVNASATAALEALASALGAKPHASRFEMRGREMDGWLRVDPEGVRTKRQLEQWVARGVKYARSLPPKG